MSIKDNIVNAIAEKVLERAKSCKNQLRKVKSKWNNRNQIEGDRYNLGALNKLQEELKWLDELMQFLGQI